MTSFNFPRDTVELLDPSSNALFKNSLITTLSTSLDNYFTISSDLSTTVFMLVIPFTVVCFLINETNLATLSTAAISFLILSIFNNYSASFFAPDTLILSTRSNFSARDKFLISTDFFYSSDYFFIFICIIKKNSNIYSLYQFIK